MIISRPRWASRTGVRKVIHLLTASIRTLNYRPEGQSARQTSPPQSMVDAVERLGSHFVALMLESAEM